MNIKKTLIGISLIGTMYGCMPNYDNIENHSSEYKIPKNKSSITTFSELEGKIIKVQPSHINYAEWRGGQTGDYSGSHEFEYVILLDSTNEIHTLIYPYSKAIFESEAKIKYRTIGNKHINSGKFIQSFLNKKYYTNDDINIETEGIIVNEGIEYKRYK